MKNYEKMQFLRIGQGGLHRYLNLLKNIADNGYDQARYPIHLNRKGHIYDGSHRIACALAFKQYNIPVKFNKILNVKPFYNKKWFADRFSENEVSDLENGELELLINSGAAFNILIWPPAMNNFHEIESYLEQKLVE